MSKRILIDSKKETTITIDIFIKKMRKKGFKVNHALHILSLTNHYATIKQVVKEINSFPLLKDRIKFKPFVLQAIRNRETSPNVYAGLKQLATEGGYLEEFEKSDARRKIYSPTDSCLISIPAVEKIVSITYSDLSSYKKLKIIRDNLPSYVRLLSSRNLPEICDFSDVEEIDLSCAIFAKNNKLIFKKNSTVIFEDNISDIITTLSLPEVLDLSNCNQVYLRNSSLKSANKIILNNVSCIHLEHSFDIPDDIDFSSCDFVFLNCAKIANIKNLNFKKDSTLELEEQFLPAHLDISNCANVKMDYVSFEFEELTFSDKKSVILKYTDFKNIALTFNKIQNLELDTVDLENVSNLSFNEVENLTFKDIDLFPATLDLSNCRNVFFMDNYDFSTLKTIKLRDKKQLDHPQALSEQSSDYQRISEIDATIIYANANANANLTYTLNNQKAI